MCGSMSHTVQYNGSVWFCALSTTKEKTTYGHKQRQCLDAPAPLKAIGLHMAGRVPIKPTDVACAKSALLRYALLYAALCTAASGASPCARPGGCKGNVASAGYCLHGAEVSAFCAGDTQLTQSAACAAHACTSPCKARQCAAHALHNALALSQDCRFHLFCTKHNLAFLLGANGLEAVVVGKSLFPLRDVEH